MKSQNLLKFTWQRHPAARIHCGWKPQPLSKFTGTALRTATQPAIAWVLAHGKDIVPIPGTKRRKYLKALDVRLSESDLRRIDEVAPKGIAAGDRYPASMMSSVNVEGMTVTTAGPRSAANWISHCRS